MDRPEPCFFSKSAQAPEAGGRAFYYRRSINPAQQIKRLIGIGFSVIVLLLLASTLLGLSYMTLANRHLHTIVKDYNVKTALVHSLRDALQQRRFNLHNFVWQTDVFEREEFWERFNEAASRYLKVREQLSTMPMAADLRAELDKLDRLTLEAQTRQLEIVELMRQDQHGTALQRLWESAKPAQDDALVQASVLVRLFENLNTQAVLDTEQSYQRVKALSLPLVLGALLLAMLIAWQIASNTQRLLEELLRQQGKYKALYETNFDAVMLWHNGRLEDCNPATLRMFGFESQAQFCRTHLLELLPTYQDNGVPSEDLLASKMNEAMAHSSSYFEWQQRRLDGSVFPAEVVLNPLCLDGRPLLQIVVRDITERREAEQRIEYLACYDALTTLPNQVLFKDRLNLCLANARRSQQKIAVMLLDLDRFKTINASLGHRAGDELLRQVGQRLAGFMPEGGTAACMGGDNFMLMLTELSTVEEATRFAGQVLALLANPVQVAGHELHVTASLGIAVYPHDGTTVETLLKHADTAMYRAKAAGGGQCRLFTGDMNSSAYRRMVLENQMLRAIDQGEFELHYQPKVETEGERLIGMEALVRWNHPELGLLGPAEFIPISEESGLILPLSEWIIHTACKQTQLWHQQGFPLRVAINLSVRQFQSNDLLPYVRRVLEATGLDPGYVEFEITESATLHAEEESLAILRAFKKVGVHISIDDFGTGYSSLSYLRKYPLDVLKIDKSFVDGLPGNTNNAAIASAIINLAHNLGYQVVAEGVETVEQLEFLRQRSCYAIQGFYFGKPMPAAEFSRYLAQKMV